MTYNPDDQSEHDNRAPRRLIAEGKCLAVLRAAQFARTTKGDEQIALGFEIVDPARPDEQGQHITYFGTFGPNSIDFTVDAIRACGWNGDDLAEVPGMAEDGQLANEVSLKIEHDTYQGKTSAKVKFVNRLGGGAKIKLERAMDQTEAQRFAASMKSRVAAAGRDRSNPPAAGSGQRQPAQRRQSTGRSDGPPPPGDDDIPF